jgi:tRNA (cmo5U34)-methyltransferase
MSNEKLRGYEWLNMEHASAYLSRADRLPHRKEAEQILLNQIPKEVKRILDLGTGDGRTLYLLKQKVPDAEGVALDFSEPMLQKARNRFAKDKQIRIIKHDLSDALPIPELGSFNVVVSSLAIHHLLDERKRQLYQEIFEILNPGGVFCNLEHVSSQSKRLHLKFLDEVGLTPETEDPSNRLLDAETQLTWLRQIGYIDVDCYWKWLEVALLVGYKS